MEKDRKERFIQPADDNQPQMYWEKNGYESKASMKY